MIICCKLDEITLMLKIIQCLPVALKIKSKLFSWIQRPRIIESRHLVPFISHRSSTGESHGLQTGQRLSSKVRFLPQGLHTDFILFPVSSSSHSSLAELLFILLLKATSSEILLLSTNSKIGALCCLS